MNEVSQLNYLLSGSKKLKDGNKLQNYKHGRHETRFTTCTIPIKFNLLYNFKRHFFEITCRLVLKIFMHLEFVGTLRNAA